MALVARQKEVALVAQQQARLDNSRFDGQLLKLKHIELSKSKQTQLDSAMKMVDMYHKIGQPVKASEMTEKAGQLLEEVSPIA